MQIMREAALSATVRTEKGSLCGLHVLPWQSAISSGYHRKAARGSRARRFARRTVSCWLQTPRGNEAQNEQSESRILGCQSRQGESSRTKNAWRSCLQLERRHLAPQHVNSPDERIHSMVEGGTRSRRSLSEMWFDRIARSTSHARVCARVTRLPREKSRRCQTPRHYSF